MTLYRWSFSLIKYFKKEWKVEHSSSETTIMKSSSAPILQERPSTHYPTWISHFQLEQQPEFWLTGCPLICTVGGRTLPMAGWLAILKPRSTRFHYIHSNLERRREDVNQPVFDWSRHGHESLLHISSIFCTCFHKRYPDFISKCLKNLNNAIRWWNLIQGL